MTRFSFEVRVEVAEPLRVGGSPGEELWFTPITGGSVDGPDLAGEVLPYGGDWLTVRDGVWELNAKYLLRSDDGSIIDVQNRGFWVEQQLPGPNTQPAPGEYYRTLPRFRTEAPSLQWMTSRVFVGLAAELDGDVHLRFFEVL